MHMPTRKSEDSLPIIPTRRLLSHMSPVYRVVIIVTVPPSVPPLRSSYYRGDRWYFAPETASSVGGPPTRNASEEKKENAIYVNIGPIALCVCNIVGGIASEVGLGRRRRLPWSRRFISNLCDICVCDFLARNLSPQFSNCPCAH